MTSAFEETQTLLNMLKESHLSVLYPVVVISVSELMQTFLSKHMLPFWNSTFYLTQFHQTEEIHSDPTEETLLCGFLNLLSYYEFYRLPLLLWLN